MGTLNLIGVIGAGQMGSGIAQVSAAAGYPTVLWDNSPEMVNKGVNSIKDRVKKQLEKGKCTQEDANIIEKNLKPGKTIHDLKGCDLVIEAIIENFDIKRNLFLELDNLLAPTAYIASNTSSISITKLAGSTKRPDKVIGLHFMNPVPVMKLVEIIRGIQTSDETYTILKTVVERMGKTTVLAIDTPGFIVNRILCPMINEAIFLVQEGVKVEDIDVAMKLGTNQPMGPLELADFVGLDTLLFILQVLHKELGEDKYRPSPLLTKYVEAGWYGKKSGRGFYRY